MNCPNCGAEPIKVNPVSGYHKWECGANEYGVDGKVFVNEVASCLRGQLDRAEGLLDEIEAWYKGVPTGPEILDISGCGLILSRRKGAE